MTDDLKARLRGSCYLAFEDGTNDYGSAPDAADRIEQLEAALTQSREEMAKLLAMNDAGYDTVTKRAVAAAYERAADAAEDYPRVAPDYDEWTRYDEQIAHSQKCIRALATPDQTTALDTIRAEAREQGMREAAQYMKRYSYTYMTVDEILAAIKWAKA